LRPARPTTRSANSSFAIEEEGDNVWIALASNEELAVEHLSQTIDRDILFNRTVEVCLANLGSNDAVCILWQKSSIEVECTQEDDVKLLSGGTHYTAGERGE
jgi:hypothetical protein